MLLTVNYRLSLIFVSYRSQESLHRSAQTLNHLKWLGITAKSGLLLVLIMFSAGVFKVLSKSFDKISIQIIIVNNTLLQFPSNVILIYGLICVI